MCAQATAIKAFTFPVGILLQNAEHDIDHGSGKPNLQSL